MMKKEEGRVMNKKISNNILVLILIVIIFVSMLGTMIVKQAIDTVKSLRTTTVQPQTSAGGAGMVSITILPSESKEEKEREKK